MSIIEKGLWELWATVTVEFPRHWYQLVAGREEFGPFHTVLCGLRSTPGGLSPTVLNAVRETLYSLTNSGWLQSPSTQVQAEFFEHAPSPSDGEEAGVVPAWMEELASDVRQATVIRCRFIGFSK